MRQVPLVLVSCWLLASCNALESSLKQSTPHISIVGEATEEVAPDLATIALGVVTERPAADEAVADNAKAAQAVVDELRAQGIEPKDIATIGVSSRLTPSTKAIRAAARPSAFSKATEPATTLR